MASDFPPFVLYDETRNAASKTMHRFCILVEKIKYLQCSARVPIRAVVFVRAHLKELLNDNLMYSARLSEKLIARLFFTMRIHARSSAVRI